MARTKQTAKKLTGGKASLKQSATKALSHHLGTLCFQPVPLLWLEQSKQQRS
jgi:hypothetical protein